jgi:hypothetical protein
MELDMALKAHQLTAIVAKPNNTTFYTQANVSDCQKMWVTVIIPT